jgi:hypothetical protein
MPELISVGMVIALLFKDINIIKQKVFQLQQINPCMRQTKIPETQQLIPSFVTLLHADPTSCQHDDVRST